MGSRRPDAQWKPSEIIERATKSGLTIEVLTPTEQVRAVTEGAGVVTSGVNPLKCQAGTTDQQRPDRRVDETIPAELTAIIHARAPNILSSREKAGVLISYGYGYGIVCTGDLASLGR